MSKFNIKKLFKKEEEIEILTMEDDKNEKNIKSFIKNNSLNLLMTSLTIIVLVLTGISISISSFSVDKILRRAGIYTQEIKSVEIESDNYDAPGSFKIDKSAKWIGKGKAQVIFDVNSVMKTDGNKYHDVILALDISGSMEGEKLDKAKSDSIELVNYLLNDSHNKVAIITFDSTSEIISNFSNNNEDLVNKINNLSVKGSTNYNVALKNIDVLMSDYQKETDRDIVTLFLTDGYPNEDTPNQVGTRDILKDKYPYLAINGIQYEMGKDIIEEIKQITDRQWVADQSTLNNVLFDAAVSPVIYEDFIVTDYIHNDYFKINSIDDIKVTIGTVELTEENGIQKITWNLGKNSYITGADAKMYINLNQKEEYLEEEGYYPTNKKENISYKLPDENEKTVNSSDTPVLKNAYEVIYDTNTPDGCTLESIPKEKHFAYQNVTKKTYDLSCEGYLFKGWEFDSEDEIDITKVNDDVFIMPLHDVTIRATWSKQDISKSMNGTVHERTTLYKVLENAAKEGTYAKEYTGEHQDSMNPSKSTEKIYHWYGSNNTNGTAILDKNNVIFANHCWQIMRTTDTGGVKMIYNGEVVDNKCLSIRDTHVGYAQMIPQNLASQYWYGTDYTYDSVSKTFKVSGTTEQTTWNATTGPGLVGKYTCKLTSEDGTCSTLYLVESYYNTSSAYAISINSNSNYSQFGELEFNETNLNHGSPTYVGYMYGDVYAVSNTEGITSQSFTIKQNMLSSTSLYTGTTYWYADSITYDSSTGKYSLVNPYQVSSISDYPNLVGKYTFGNSRWTYTATNVLYIAAVNNNTMYFKQLQSGNLLPDYDPIVFGDSIHDNGDGTYTINNPIDVALSDWYTNYANYKNKYTCNDSNSTCSSPRYTTATTSTNYTYINASEKIMIGKTRSGLTITDTLLIKKDEWYNNYGNYNDYKYTCNTETAICTEATLRMILGYSAEGYNYVPSSIKYLGSSVIWNGENYTLVGPIDNFNNLADISTHHYICVSNGLKTCETVAYVYYYAGSGKMYYITLGDGVTTVDKALEHMFTKNTTNSTIKSGVDAWYRHYLLEDYDNYIEDTIYCNDRSIRTLGGWNPDGGMTNADLQFKEYSVTSDLSCTNTTDKFSVSNSSAQLSYKVGLMSSPEMKLNNSNVRKTGQQYWLASPIYFSVNTAVEYIVHTNGNMYTFYGTTVSLGVRPAISLIPGIEYSDGDGSMEHPYIVDLDE